MSKKFGDLIAKILSGEKKIESRWIKNKSAPWGKVRTGDRIYFKDSGELVSAMAEVEKVAEFTDLEKAAEIFGDASWKKDKKYCVLIWLKNPKRVEPFRINKAGFGTGAAWLCLDKEPIGQVIRKSPYGMFKSKMSEKEIDEITSMWDKVIDEF